MPKQERGMMTMQNADLIDIFSSRSMEMPRTDNTCVCCGRIIPEGRNICLACGDYDDMQTFRKPEQKPKTNGDVIRSMSDEELIPVIMEWVCNTFFRGKQACPQAHCDDCVRQWLREEVKENDD